MRATPAPVRGASMAGRDVPARAIRVSAHPEVDRVVVSLWNGDRCTGTVRLAPEDVAELVAALSTAAVSTATGVPAPSTARMHPGGLPTAG